MKKSFRGFILFFIVFTLIGTGLVSETGAAEKVQYGGTLTYLKRGIEVGQPVTRLPPHRPRRAELPHRVPQNYSLGCFCPQKAISSCFGNFFSVIRGFSIRKYFRSSLKPGQV